MQAVPNAERGFASPLIALGVLGGFLFTGFIYLNKDFFQSKLSRSLGIDTSIQKAANIVAVSPSPTPSPVISPSPKPSVIVVASALPKPSSTPTATKASTTTTGVPGNGFGRANVVTERGTFGASIIVLNNPTMVTDTANDSNCATDCPVTNLADFARKNGAFAGIHGTYFCPDSYPECQDKKNSFDFPVYNSRLGKWINEDKLFWDGRSMIYQDGGGYHFARDAKNGPGGPSAGIVNYPALVDGGQVVVDQGGLSSKLQGKGTKGGIGINGNKVFLVVASNVDSLDFAHIFKSIGATHALNLDGGGSIAMWYGGNYVAGPGRNLPNAILFR